MKAAKEAIFTPSPYFLLSHNTLLFLGHKQKIRPAAGFFACVPSLHSRRIWSMITYNKQEQNYPG